MKSRGFLLVEALLAMTIFAFLATALIGAIVYGRASTNSAGDHTRAMLLADEGLEATRNIRDASYGNLTDGTYGLVLSGGTWTLSGSSDVSDIFTRSVTITTASINRKTVTTNVSWASGLSSGTVSAVTRLTNWIASTVKSWANAYHAGSVDVTGTTAAYKVATSGSYAYYVRNSATGPNFFIVNITNPTSPTVVGTLTLTGTPTNVAVSGNYAYVSNSSSSAELQIVNVTTPTAPALAGTYNATGTAGGRGVYIQGTTAYLVRSANGGSDEFVEVNVTNPASPTRIGGYALNVTMYEVYVTGTVAYIATGSDTQEVLVVNMVVPGTLTLGTSIDLTGTTDATTIDGTGNYIVVGQGTNFTTISNVVALIPIVNGSITMAGTVNDVAVDATHGYGMVGTNAASAEFQVMNLAVLTAPTLLRSVDISGTVNLTGISYNTVNDVAPGASNDTARESMVFAPN